MYKFLLTLVVAITICIPSIANAGFGTGIGITFPVSGSGSSVPNTNCNYAAIQFDNIIQELTVEKRNGTLFMELKVTNSGDLPYSVSHRDGQLYDFVITDKYGEKLWQWSDNMVFTQALTSSSIDTHSFVVYKVELDSKIFHKIKDSAILVTAYMLDTPYKLSTKVPTRTAANGTPIFIHGGIILGN